MIEIDGKEYLNLQEQVCKNKQDIKALKFGLNIIGTVPNVPNLPKIGVELGNTCLVGVEYPYYFYVATNIDSFGAVTWTNLGLLASTTPGPQGPQGIPGIDGIRGTHWTIGASHPVYDGSQIIGDIYLEINKGYVYQLDAEYNWILYGSIKGLQGVPGARGEIGPVGPQGPIGPQGPQGIPGLQFSLKGTVDAPSKLPVPPLDPLDAYIVKGSDDVAYLYVWIQGEQAWWNSGIITLVGSVEANPEAAATVDLVKIRIDNVVYSINKTQLDAITARLKAVEDNVEMINTDISDLEERVTANTTRSVQNQNNITGLEDKTDATNSRVEAINTAVQSHDESILKLIADDNRHEGDIDQLNTLTGAMQEQVNGNALSIKQNKDAIAKINDFIQSRDLLKVEETFDGKGFNIPSTVRVGNNDYSVQDNQKFLLSSATGRTVKSKNLFDGKWLTGTSISSSTGNNEPGDAIAGEDFIVIAGKAPNTKVYDVEPSFYLVFRYYDKDKKYLGTVFSENAYYMRFMVWSGGSIIDKIKVMVSFDTINNFIPYFSGLKDSRLNVIQSFDTTDAGEFVADKTRIKYFEITHKGPTADYSPGWLAEFSIYANKDYKLILQYQTVGGGNYYLIGINNKTGQSILQMELTPYTVYNLEEIALEGHTHKNWQLDHYNPLFKHEEIYTNTILTFKAVIDSVGGVDIPLKGVNNIGDEVVAREVGDTGLYDIIKIKRFGIAEDLSIFKWELANLSLHIYLSNTISDKIKSPLNNEDVINAISSGSFNVISRNDVERDANNGKPYISIGSNTNGTLFIVGENNNPEDLEKHLKNVILVYELATPVEEVLYTGIPEGAISALAKQGGFIEFSSPDSVYGADLNRVKMQFKINYWGGK